MTRPVERPPEADLCLRTRVPAAHAGVLLLDYLCRRFRYHSRDQWRDELDAGRLELDGRRAAGDEVLRASAQLCYRKVHREPPVSRDIVVLHREPAFLVASKPAHLPMHADGPFVRHTFVHILGERLGLSRLHLLQRLDRETSGLVVVALDDGARQRLGEQWERGLVAKSYLAVVRGRVRESFVCEAPIGRALQSRISLRRAAGAAAAAGQPAATAFDVLAATDDASLLRCRPRTGRTHQIRVHLEHAGHGLLGDKLYGRPDADYLAFVQRMKAGGDPRDVPAHEPDRQLLHASELTFADPTTGAPRRFVAPLPDDFRRWLDRLGLPLADGVGTAGPG